MNGVEVSIDKGPKVFAVPGVVGEEFANNRLELRPSAGVF
jgi:hypothetical protein